MSKAPPRKQRERSDDSSVAGGGLGAFGNSLPAALLRAREAVMARMRPILRRHDVTEQQWRVLRTLGDAGEIEVTELARSVFLLPSSLSRILRDLAARGMIDRRTPSHDLRTNLVSLTPQGVRFIATVGPEIAQATTEIEKACGRTFLLSLHNDLSRLEKAMEGDSFSGGQKV